MYSRLKIAALVAATAGGPYVVSETDLGRSVTDSVTSTLGTVTDAQYVSTASNSVLKPVDGVEQIRASGIPSHAHYEVEKLRGVDSNRYRYDEPLARKLGALPTDAPTGPALVGVSVPDLREVLRFDITPQWVIDRFSRVSTVLAQLNLKGLRVPIVTGTRADDMAGTLTYYFDHRGTLQRLTIHGFTGKPDRLVHTMTQFYGLQNEPALEAGVFTRRWNGVPVHFLRLTHAPVVYSDAVHQKYTVFLELNQPNLAYGISDEAKRIVTSDRTTGRW